VERRLGLCQEGRQLSPAFGIGGAASRWRPDGTGRRFLEVGEDPPNGALVYYRLPDGFSGPVRLSFLDAAGRTVNTLASDDLALPGGKKPGTQPGLNRVVCGTFATAAR
jgi:hypothetical protein